MTSPETTDAALADRLAADQAIFAAASAEAAAFHGGEGRAIYTPAERRAVAETARIIARRRGWKPLAERLEAPHA